MAENKWVTIGLFHVSGIRHVPFFFVVGAHLVGSFFQEIYTPKKIHNDQTPPVVLMLVFFKSKVFKDVFQPWMHQKKAKKNPSLPSRQLNVLSSGTWLQYNNFEGLQRCLFLSTSIFMFYVFCLSRVSRTNNKTRNKKNKKTQHSHSDENTNRRFFRRQQWAAMSYWQQVEQQRASMISWHY